MTSIPALSPVPASLPTATEAENHRRAMSNGPDFKSHLKAQSKPHPLPAAPASAVVLSESPEDLSRHPEVEAMLQLLAGRKIALNAPSKTGRSVPGTLASGLAVPAYSFADHALRESAETINLTLADEHTTVVSSEPGENPTARRANSCGNDLIAGDPCDGGLNAAAIAVALSGSTLIWVPAEIVRAPLQSPRIRVWRRRPPPLPDGQQPDQSSAEVDTH